MAEIRTVRADHYLIPLPQVLIDSMHGQMAGFEVVTARIIDTDRQEGVGDTFTCAVDGIAPAPDRPGHGVSFNWQNLEGIRA